MMARFKVTELPTGDFVAWCTTCGWISPYWQCAEDAELNGDDHWHSKHDGLHLPFGKWWRR